MMAFTKYWIKTPVFVQRLFPQFIWRFETNVPSIFLTFDDGPTPYITEWILEQLAKYNAKATFFCIGQQIEQHPSIFEQIIIEQHAVGNHTYTHPSGWGMAADKYLWNIHRCSQLMDSCLFRPPYGRIGLEQARLLKEYPNILSNQFNTHTTKEQAVPKIILWDVLSADFDRQVSMQQCWENIVNNTQNGSIIVLHDKVRTTEKIEYLLPKILAYYTNLGYQFTAIL